MRQKAIDYWAKSKSEIAKSIKEDYTPRETAFSFALGSFIVLVPTSAMGLPILAAIAIIFDRINKIALFSTAIIFNPVVNMAFYGLSYVIGSMVLGMPKPSLNNISLIQTFTISQTLIVGSILTASVIAAISYLVVHKISDRLQTNQTKLNQSSKRVEHR